MRLQTRPQRPAASFSEAGTGGPRNPGFDPHLDSFFFTVPGPLPAPVTDDPQFAAKAANVPSSGLAPFGTVDGTTLHL